MVSTFIHRFLMVLLVFCAFCSKIDKFLVLNFPGQDICTLFFLFGYLHVVKQRTDRLTLCT